MSRFDYVKYDQRSMDAAGVLKNICEELEIHIHSILGDGVSKTNALTKLEEAYMWLGKAIRDDQNHRNK